MLAMSSLAARVRRDVHDLIARIRLTRTAALDVLDRLDPNDDPGADRLTLSALVALIVALGLSAGMWLRWKYPPMQDFGHHVALAAVVADYVRISRDGDRSFRGIVTTCFATSCPSISPS